ncbi:hypothetical protein COOONC_20165, partial [Cooperia oncophora]
LFSARSLKNKIHDLHSLIETCKPGLIFITETWLNSKITDSELCSVFPYSVIRKDRTEKTGGGPCALLHNFVLYETVEFDCGVLNANVRCFDVFLPSSRNHRFLLIYRPPQSTLSQDEQLVTVISDLVSTSLHNVTVLGDLNLNIDWCSHVALNSEAQKFLSTFDKSFFGAVDSYADVDDAYNRFASVINAHFSALGPKHIINLFEQRERLFLSSKQPSTKPLFIEVSRKLNSQVRRFSAYKIRKMAQSSHMKKLYEFIKKVKPSSHVSHILVDSDGRKYSTDASKAGSYRRTTLPVYLERQAVVCHLCHQSLENVLKCPIVSLHVVLKNLLSSKGSVSLTADGIPQVLYKEFSEYLAIPLAHILNICLLLGEVPSVWKNSFVTPLPKVSNSNLISNFRPISILPTPLNNNGEDSEGEASPSRNFDCPHRPTRFPSRWVHKRATNRLYALMDGSLEVGTT